MTIQTQLGAIAQLRLPDLQAKFAEVVGETTRCPNKTYLLRRIREALEAAPTPPDPAPLRELTVEGLRAHYVQVVGRETGSNDRRYLMWKIRQAERGRVQVGPVQRRQPGVAHKVLPLRMPAETVAALDEVWRRHGMKSRMDLFRQALGQYLTKLGEVDAAASVWER